MFKLGKLLFGLAVAGFTAATVYNYLDESKESDEDFENDLPEDEAEEEEDPAEDIYDDQGRLRRCYGQGERSDRP